VSRGAPAEAVDVAFDEGFTFVNPFSVRKQIEGQISRAWRRDVAGNHHKGRRVVEGNFD
jgi:hypothetical protein